MTKTCGRLTRGVATAVLAVTPVACSGGGDGDVAAFCALMDELEATGGEVTDEQVEEAVDAAPEEIREDAETLADAFERFGNDPANVVEALKDGDIADAAERVSAFREAECPEDDDGSSSTSTTATGATGEEGEGAVGGSGQSSRFCEIADLTQSPGLDVLDEWLREAPDHLEKDVSVLVQTTKAQIEGREPPFDQEAIVEATQRVGAFISENC